MPIRIYISPRVGNGSDGNSWTTAFSDAEGPYRVRIRRYFGAGSSGQELTIPGRNASLMCVTGTAAEHAAAAADTAIVPIMPATVADLPALVSVLNTPFASLGTASWRTTTRTKVEAFGINTAWIVAGSTLRHFLRACVKMAYLSSRYEDNAAFQEFIAAGLDVTVSTLSASCRTAIAAWMDARGLDRSWIVPATTTVRQVQNFIAGNLAFPKAIFGDGEN